MEPPLALGSLFMRMESFPIHCPRCAAVHSDGQADTWTISENPSPISCGIADILVNQLSDNLRINVPGWYAERRTMAICAVSLTACTLSVPLSWGMHDKRAVERSSQGPAVLGTSRAPPGGLAGWRAGG